jgi:hypothetical protein
MANFYIVRSGTAGVPNANNTNNFTQINAVGVIPAGPNDLFIVDPAVNSGFSFSGAGGTSITLQFLLSSTAGTGVNTQNVIIGNNMNATVTVAPGIDIDNIVISAGVANNLTMTIGSGASVGRIDGANNETIINAGDGVTFNGVNTIPSNSATITVGDDARFNFGVNMEGTNAEQSLTTGDNAFFASNIEMSASGSTYTIDLGADSNVVGNINMGGSSITSFVTLGSGTTIGSDGNGDGNIDDADVDDNAYDEDVEGDDDVDDAANDM